MFVMTVFVVVGIQFENVQGKGLTVTVKQPPSIADVVDKVAVGSKNNSCTMRRISGRSLALISGISAFLISVKSSCSIVPGES